MIHGLMVGVPLTITAIITYIATGNFSALFEMAKLTFSAIFKLF